MNLINGSGEFCWTNRTYIGLFPSRHGVREFRYDNINGQAVVQGDIVVGTVQEIQRQTLPHFLERFCQFREDLPGVESAESREALRTIIAAATRLRLARLVRDLVSLDDAGLPPELNKAVEIVAKSTGTWSLDDILPLGLEGISRHPFGNIVHGSNYAWPNARVPYIFDEIFNEDDKPAVQQAIQLWNNTGLVNIASRLDSDVNYVRFVTQPGVNNSSLGMQGGEQQINLQEGVPYGRAMHEIGHSLGLEHEHCRTDRDDYVYVYLQNVIPSALHNFDISGDAENAYDYGSIMHYPEDAFAIEGSGYLTLAPKQEGVTIGQRLALSAGDLAATQIMYPGIIGSFVNRRRSQVVVKRGLVHSNRSAQAVAGAAPQCPGTTGIDTNVQLASNHQYSITNDGDQDIVVTIVAQLTDSRGNQNSETQNNVVVGAHGSESATLQVFLLAAYNPSGVVTVTATTTVSGGASASASGHCFFQVVGS